MRMVLLAGLAAFAAGCGGSSSPTAPSSTTTTTVVTSTTTTTTATVTTRTFTGVAYAQASPNNVLDLTLPASGNGPFPVVVFIHGGGFSSGTRKSNTAERALLVTAGYAVASIDYRLSGEAKFPAQIYDVKAAIRFLKANATTYALNPNRIATFGTSAGAGLAALAAVSGGVPTLEDLSMGSGTQTSRVQAFIDFFGPIDFLTMDAQLQQLGYAGGHDSASSPESLLLGAPIQSRPDLCRFYNPETYISLDDPPGFIQHGAEDNQIPYLQGQTFASKLAAVIGATQVRWSTIPGADHSDPLFATNANMALVVTFLDSVLK